MSLRYILNKSGPKIDPCGTPVFISDQELYELFTFVLCFLFDR